jgi:predicted transport protein
MSYADDPQVQSMIDNMPEKTGKSLEEWFEILNVSGLQKHGQMMTLLKSDYGVSHGYANTIVLIYRQQAEGGSQADDDLIAAQYEGAKTALRPVYEAVVAATAQFGKDVEIAPKKTYVSLRRSKQFAIVQAATKTRVDLGLNLKGADPTDRLEGSVVFSGMCTHKVKLSAVDEVDEQVVDWLRQAYDLA